MLTDPPSDPPPIRQAENNGGSIRRHTPRTPQRGVADRQPRSATLTGAPDGAAGGSRPAATPGEGFATGGPCAHCGRVRTVMLGMEGGWRLCSKCWSDGAPEAREAKS